MNTVRLSVVWGVVVNDRIYCSCALSYQPVIHMYSGSKAVMWVFHPLPQRYTHSVMWHHFPSIIYPHHDESTWFYPLLSKEESVMLLRERVDETFMVRATELSGPKPCLHCGCCTMCETHIHVFVCVCVCVCIVLFIHTGYREKWLVYIMCIKKVIGSNWAVRITDMTLSTY